MDLLLCNSYYLAYELVETAREKPYPPLGILYLASYLHQKSLWTLRVFDTTFSYGFEEFANIVNESRPKVVGIQGVITTRQNTRKMIEIAKHSGSIVVVGGPDPSVSCKDYLYWVADVVIIGEGEVTFKELLKVISGQFSTEDLQAISGLAFINPINNSLTLTKPRDRIQDLNTIPYPAYHMIDINRYLATWKINSGYSSMHLITSRGCPYQCVWCSHAVFGQTFRQRSVENVIGEMKMLVDQYNPDHFTIADDTLGINKQWIAEWCQKLNQENLFVPFRCFSRANLVDETMLLQLKDAGCRHIFLGVESGSQKVLDSMKKGTTVEQIRKASRLIKSVSIDLGFFIMFAFPSETGADVHQTLDLINEIEPDSLGISLAYPVPGTQFYEQVKDRLIDSNDPNIEGLGSARHLRFKSRYPDLYYQLVINHLEMQRESKQNYNHPFKNIWLKVRSSVDYIVFRIIEKTVNK